MTHHEHDEDDDEEDDGISAYGFRDGAGVANALLQAISATGQPRR